MEQSKGDRPRNLGAGKDGASSIGFDLPQKALVSLGVYDVRGRLVRTLVHGSQPAGTHEVMWDGVDNSGRKVSAGVYLYRFRAGSFEATRSVVVIR